MELSADTDPLSKLCFVLTVNAATSGLAGLLALADAERVDDWLGTGYPGWVRIIGASLAAFALAIVASFAVIQVRLVRNLSGSV